MARHDASAFSKADCHRAKRAGQPLGLRAALAEVRGDWKMFGEVFGFPKWNTKAGVCWRCNCRPDQVSGNTNTAQTIYVQRDRERERERESERDFVLRTNFLGRQWLMEKTPTHLYTQMFMLYV